MSEQIAQMLESFGSSRANYRQLSDKQRNAIAKRIAIHLTRQKVDGPIRDEEQQQFFYLCAECDIKYSEARALWYNATRGMSWDDVK